MVHSVKNRKKKEKKMRTLRKRTEKLAKLASHQMEEVVEMTLPYIALGDLRRRWRQKETPLHPVLLKKLDKFKRIKIQKDKPFHISGSDGGKRLCGEWLGCAINKGGNNPNQTNRHRNASEAQYGYSGLISCGDYQ